MVASLKGGESGISLLRRLSEVEATATPSRDPLFAGLVLKGEGHEAGQDHCDVEEGPTYQGVYHLARYLSAKNLEPMCIRVGVLDIYLAPYMRGREQRDTRCMLPPVDS